MIIKTFATCAAFSLLLGVTSAFAQKSTIAGDALGADGRPIKNAQIWIQQENSKSPAVTAKTDSKGHFIATGLPVGTYGVVLLSSGKVTSAAVHVKTRDNQTVHLNLGGKHATAVTVVSIPVQKKKRSVWVQAPTGSHIGGGYQDEDSETSSDPQNGGPNVDRMSRSQLERMQNRISTPAGSGGR